MRQDINPKLMNGVMSKIRIPFPPFDEQRSIGDELSTYQAKLSPLKVHVASSVDRLREFRSAIITAAVTGQIDVVAWGKRGRVQQKLDDFEMRVHRKEARG